MWKDDGTVKYGGGMIGGNEKPDRVTQILVKSRNIIWSGCLSTGKTISHENHYLPQAHAAI